METYLSRDNFFVGQQSVLPQVLRYRILKQGKDELRRRAYFQPEQEE